MDSLYLARLEFEIYTAHLQIPPQACPPNPYWLLGLAPDCCDAARVRQAGQQRIAYLQSILNPTLQPAIPYVIDRVEAAMAELADRDTAGDVAAVATFASQSQGDPGSQRLIKIAAVVGCGTLVLLLAMILLTGSSDTAAPPVAQNFDAPASSAAVATPVVPPAMPAASATPAQEAKAAAPSSAPSLPANAPLPSDSPIEVTPLEATPLEKPAAPTLPARADMANAETTPSTLPRLLPETTERLPEAVDLPSLITQTAGQALFSLTSSPTLALDSGASQMAWELKRQPDADSQAVWAVVPPPMQARELVATDEQPIGWFLVNDEGVRFRWASEGISPTFNQLRNCVLELTIAGKVHRVALRKPREMEPQPITLFERREKIALPTGDWPAADALFLEVLECTGFDNPPSITPDSQRVAGKTRGTIVLPGWSRAEINFGLAGSNDAPMVLIESVFYLNNGQTELTRSRVQQTLVNLQNNLAKDKQALANYQQRGEAAEREADRVRNSVPNGGGNAQAFVLLRDRQLSQIAQEIAKCNVGVQRMRSSIPRTEAAIASVQQLGPQMEQWTRDTAIHWRVGATTDHGEIILMTTRP